MAGKPSTKPLTEGQREVSRSELMGVRDNSPLGLTAPMPNAEPDSQATVTRGRRSSWNSMEKQSCTVCSVLCIGQCTVTAPTWSLRGMTKRQSSWPASEGGRGTSSSAHVASSVTMAECTTHSTAKDTSAKGTLHSQGWPCSTSICRLRSFTSHDRARMCMGSAGGGVLFPGVLLALTGETSPEFSPGEPPLLWRRGPPPGEINSRQRTDASSRRRSGRGNNVRLRRG